MIVGGQGIEPGEHRVIRIPITEGLNGGDLGLWVHAVRGREPGPVLALLSTLHGGEWFSIEPLRNLVQSIDTSTLRGTLLVVPVVNPPGLALTTRNIPDESDSPDLNRIFPGPLTWTSDQLIAAVSREVLAQATHLIDFHPGPWGSVFLGGQVGNDFPKPGLSDEVERLLLAFGVPHIRRSNVLTGFPGPNSSVGYGGGVLGIPALGINLGGPGFGPEWEERWRRQITEGIQAVMGAIGMLDQATVPDPRPARQLIFRHTHRVNSRKGGFLRPRFGPEDMGKEVEAGTLLGEVANPYTFEIVEELRAPVRGVLWYLGRAYPIHPGDWAFGIATLDEHARWVESGVVAA